MAQALTSSRSRSGAGVQPVCLWHVHSSCGTWQRFGLFCYVRQHENICVSGIGPWVPNNSFAGLVLDEKSSVAGVSHEGTCVGLCWAGLAWLGLARQVCTPRAPIDDPCTPFFCHLAACFSLVVAP